MILNGLIGGSNSPKDPMSNRFKAADNTEQSRNVRSILVSPVVSQSIGTPLVVPRAALQIKRRVTKGTET